MTGDKSTISLQVSGGQVQGVLGANQVSIDNLIINNYPRQEDKASPSALDINIGINPYKGLAHFGPDDHDRFFGRQELTEKLKSAVTNQTFTALLGPSGSGKSSIALSGLAPCLASEGNWLFSYFRVSDNSSSNPYQALTQALTSLYLPEAAPSQQLVEAKRLASYLEEGKLSFNDICDAIRKNHPGKRLLLIADQFEELYTTGIPIKTQHRFVELLMQLEDTSLDGNRSAPVVLLLTMRADFLAQAASHAGFAKLLDQHTHIVGPMEREQLREAIVKPAELQGVSFEAELVETILDDIETAHANLPLLEFALSELWNLQSDKSIRLVDYQNIGRVSGALTQRAQSIFEELSFPQKQSAQRLFCQLVKIGQGTEDTRRIAKRGDFLPKDWMLVQQLASENERLIVTNRQQHDEKGELETAEVVHEALIQHWPLLRQWVNENRTFLTWQESLRLSEEQWRKYHKDTGSLLRGTALHQALEWQNKNKESLSQSLLSYIEISQKQESKEANRKKLRTKLLSVVAVFTIVTLASLGLSLGGALQQAELRQKRVEAERENLLVTQSRFLADRSWQYLEKGNSRLSILLALEALPDTSTSREKQRPIIPEAHSALYANLGKYRDHLWLSGHTKGVNHATFSHDGQRIVTASSDNTARLWDAQSGQLLATLSGHTKGVNQATFSPDGQRIVTASWDNTARIWDAQSGKLLATLSGHTDSVEHASFSSDGKRIVTASSDNTARIWDTLSGKLLATLSGHTDSVEHASFSSDGQRIVTASSDNTARLWGAQSGKLIAILSGHTGSVPHATFSPDGQRIVTASWDSTARLWDALSGQPLAILRGHTFFVDHATFSPDGQRIVTASKDNTARLWDAQSGKLFATLRGHTRSVEHAAFSSDGRQIVTTSWDSTARLWDTRSGQNLAILSGHTKRINHAAFSSDGQRIVTASEDNTARIWDAHSKQGLIILKAQMGFVPHAAFSHDGEHIVTASFNNNTAHVWDAQSGQLLATLSGHTKGVNQATFSPDGQRIVTASWDNTARIWDALSGKLLATLSGHTKGVNQATFSPDGQRIVTASRDYTARIWDALSGKLLATLSGHTDSVEHAAFSPDGRHIVTASLNNPARLWDAQSEKTLAILSADTGYVTYVTFSPNGQRIVTASSDNTARLWGTQSGQLLATLSGHEDYVTHATFSPDGQRIVTTSNDNTARVWDAQSGEALATMSEDLNFSASLFDSINYAAFSPDGRHIATASLNNTARLWDAQSGQLLAILSGHTGFVTYVTFSPNGQHIMTSSWDGTARLWRYFRSTQGIVEYFKSLNLPQLTAQERHDNYLD